MRKSSLKDNILWSLERSMGHFLVIGVIFLFLVSFLVWAYYNKIEKTVRAQGIVETNLTDKIVGHYDGGLVEKVFVQEGDKIKAGEPIVTIANTNITKERNKSFIRKQLLEAKLARLSAESNGDIDSFAKVAKTAEEFNELELARYRQESLREKIKILDTQIKQTKAIIIASKNHMTNMIDEERLIKEQHDLLEPLVKKGIGSKQLLLQRKGDLAKITTSISEIDNKQAEYVLDIKELEQRIQGEKLDFSRDVGEEMNKVTAELLAVKEELIAADEQIVRSVVRSPINGTIYKLSANTVGGIVRSGEALAEIVPSEAKIRIEGKVQPSDRTKIWNGMLAKVRPSSYEFSRKTILHAEIVNISAKTYFDELTRTWYYRVILTTVAEDADKTKDFLPGMIVEVNILSGEESVFDYLLSPITRGMNGALSEHNTR